MRAVFVQTTTVTVTEEQLVEAEAVVDSNGLVTIATTVIVKPEGPITVPLIADVLVGADAEQVLGPKRLVLAPPLRGTPVHRSAVWVENRPDASAPADQADLLTRLLAIPGARSPDGLSVAFSTGDGKTTTVTIPPAAIAAVAAAAKGRP